MSKEMLINVSEGEECRIAIVDNGRLEELHMERTSATSHVNNIYKGRVTNVEPSIQAAFVDFGLGRNGFLHISDLMPSYFGGKAEEVQEAVGRKMARRDRPPIQRCLRRGDEIVVQIIKEGIGTKGPTLSTYLSIPGRILVMMPGMTKLGVSRKIEDEEERRRLRQILDSLKPPRDAGFIIRTAGIGKSKQEIQRDLQYLTRLWQNIEKKRKSGPGPMELYTEGDLVTRTVRDVYTSDIERIVIDNEAVAERVQEFMKIAMPRTRHQVELYRDAVPLFHKYGIEREIEQMYSRHVPLPSGGSLVIDSTEAIVAIDVNSGKFRDHSDAEMTAFKTDLEAADEIPRQLKLRDLGGVIICDFIDLRYERHRRELEKRLHENLRNDRAKTKMLRMSQFGIIEMTRQRMRPSLKRSIYADCPHCKGAGLVKTPESMGLDVMRKLAIAVNDQRVARVELAVCPDVAFYLQNRKRAALAELEARFGKRIVIRGEASLSLDAVNLSLYDARDGLVFLDELGMLPQAPVAGQAAQAPAQQSRTPQQPQRGQQRGEGRRGGRDQRQQQQGGRDQRRGSEQRGQDHQRGQQSHRQHRQMPDENEIDRIEEAVEDRETALQESALPEMEIASRPPEVRRGEPELEDVDEAPAPMEEEIDELFSAHPAGEPQSARSQAERQEEFGGRGRGGRGRRFRGRPGRGEAAGSGQMPAQEMPETAEPEPQAPTPAAPTAELESPDQAGPAEASPVQATTGEEPEAAKGKRRRGGRSAPRSRSATSRSRRKKKSDEAAPEQPAAAIVQPESPRAAAPVRAAPADRHLVRDEPVLPQPITRPRSYRDLDQIPDDFD